MAKYTTYEECWKRYKSVSDLDPSDVNSYHLPYVDAEIDSMLAEYVGSDYLSSGNLTLRDLATDMAYLRVVPVTLDEKKAKKIMERVDKAFKAIISGERVMVMVSGNTVRVEESFCGHTNEGYSNTFGMADIIHQEIDPDRIEDELNGH